MEHRVSMVNQSMKVLLTIETILLSGVSGAKGDAGIPGRDGGSGLPGIKGDRGLNGYPGIFN